MVIDLNNSKSCVSAGYREVASYKGNSLIADKTCPDTSRFFVTGVEGK